MVFKQRVAIILTALAATTSAHAVTFYDEFGGGLTQIRGGSPFYTASDGSATNFGLALNAAFLAGINGGQGSEFGELQFGLLARYSSGSSSGTNFTFLSAYPIVRLQVFHAYVGAGVTPLIWSRTASALGFDGLQMASGNLGILGQGGIIWPVTPKFDLIGELTLQAASASGVLSPKPVIDATINMRFRIGEIQFGSRRDSRPDGPWKGWRYPFGNEMQN